MLKVNVFRRTPKYWDKITVQDREYPASVSYDNYLTSIMDNKGYTQYNFQFGSLMSQYKTDGVAYKKEVANAESVRRIVIWFYQANGLLRGLQLFDRDG